MPDATTRSIDPEAIRGRYIEETAELLRGRLPVLVFAFWVTYAAVWVIESQTHDGRTFAYGLSFAGALIAHIAGLWISRRRVLSPPACVVVSLFIALTTMTSTTVYELIVHGEAEVLALGLIYVLVASMVILPWGPRAQAAAVVASVTLYVVANTFGLQSVAPVGMLVIGLVGIGTLSVVSADRLEQFRFSVFRQTAELADANTELQRANDALSEANRAKAQCLANVSHEFRTPLNVIIGFTQLVEEGALGQIPGDVHDALGRVLTNSWMLLGLVNDFLDFSRLEANRLTLHMEPVPVGRLCVEVGDLVDPLLSGKPVQLSCHPEGDLVVHADRARLRQVLVNLLTNAVKFTERGEISVAACDLDDGWGVIEVRDTGCGIPPAELELIFEPFRRGSMSGRIGGIGIGLALARQLAEAMGGTLSVSSEAGLGSTFTVRLARDTTTPSTSDLHLPRAAA